MPTVLRQRNSKHPGRGLNRSLAGWSGFYGFGVAVLPEYSGSSTYRTLPLPMFSLNWKDRLLISPFGGVRVNFRPGQALGVGPVLQYASGRDDRGALSDFRDISGGAAAGLFASYRAGRVQVGADVIQALTGGVEGYRGRLRLSIDSRPAPRVMIALNPSISWLSRDWAETQYGVSESDAERSGFQAFEPGSGFSEVRLDTRISYLFSRQSAVTALLGVGRLIGDAADSPIVTEAGRPEQAFVGIMFTRRL